MINANDLINEEIVFDAVWNDGPDTRRSGKYYKVKLYVTHKKIYWFRFFNDDMYFEHKIVLNDELGSIVLKDSSGTNISNCIFLDAYDRNYAGSVLSLSFDNTEKGRILAEKVFVAISKVIK